jgi:hypothetical protein
LPGAAVIAAAVKPVDMISITKRAHFWQGKFWGSGRDKNKRAENKKEEIP